MCNFVRGEVIAIGPLGDLRELPQNLPGQLLLPTPLVTEAGTLGATPFNGIGTVVLKTDPGAELFAMTQLAAVLAPQIRKGKAIVDLNHRIPLSAEPDPTDLRLTPKAQHVVAELRAWLRRALQPAPRGKATVYRMAVLDSGFDDRLILHRKYEFFDYSKGGRLTLGESPSDPRGHGTKVIRLLDEILPPDVELMIGRLPSLEVELTTLVVAHALGDLVARTAPDVVNMSLSTVDQVVLCPSCRQRVALPAFFSSMLPMVIRLSGTSSSGTVAVMAAGNEGRASNSRWIHADLSNLVLAVAQNRRGHRAKYSAAPEGPTADLYSASVFGGDDPTDAEPMGVFSDGTHGTSFAAPFVSAAALFAKQLPNRMLAPAAVTDLGVRVQAILDGNLSVSPAPLPNASGGK